MVDERGLEHNPIQKVKAPKQTDVTRNAYTRDVIDQYLHPSMEDLETALQAMDERDA